MLFYAKSNALFRMTFFSHYTELAAGKAESQTSYWRLKEINFGSVSRWELQRVSALRMWAEGREISSWLANKLSRWWIDFWLEAFSLPRRRRPNPGSLSVTPTRLDVIYCAQLSRVRRVFMWGQWAKISLGLLNMAQNFRLKRVFFFLRALGGSISSPPQSGFKVFRKLSLTHSVECVFFTHVVFMHSREK